MWAWNGVSDVEPGYYGSARSLFAVAVAAVIAAAVQPGRGPIRSPLSCGPLRWIGTISYGLYLWHWPINIWLVHWRLGFGGTALNVLRLAVTFAFATASYYLVERPIRQGCASRRPGACAGSRRPGSLLVVAHAADLDAGATKPPTLLRPRPRSDRVSGAPQPTSCGPRSRRSAARASGRRSTDDASRGSRVLLVGDSIACSLWPGLKVVGRGRGHEGRPGRGDRVRDRQRRGRARRRVRPARTPTSARPHGRGRSTAG